MAEQGPSVAVVILDIVPGVEEFPQLRKVLLDREMGGRPSHGGSPLRRLGRECAPQGISPSSAGRMLTRSKIVVPLACH